MDFACVDDPYHHMVRPAHSIPRTNSASKHGFQGWQTLMSALQPHRASISSRLGNKKLSTVTTGTYHCGCPSGSSCGLSFAVQFYNSETPQAESSIELRVAQRCFRGHFHHWPSSWLYRLDALASTCHVFPPHSQQSSIPSSIEEGSIRCRRNGPISASYTRRVCMDQGTCRLCRGEGPSRSLHPRKAC